METSIFSRRLSGVSLSRWPRRWKACLDRRRFRRFFGGGLDAQLPEAERRRRPTWRATVLPYHDHLLCRPTGFWDSLRNRDGADGCFRSRVSPHKRTQELDSWCGTTPSTNFWSLEIAAMRKPRRRALGRAHDLCQWPALFSFAHDPSSPGLAAFVSEAVSEDVCAAFFKGGS